MYLPPVLLQTPFPNWVVVSGGSSPWYLDALKAAAGSLFGAAVAFFFAVLHRQMQERNANLQAGNLALFKLRAIQRRTGELRLSVRHEIVARRKAYSDAPAWTLLRPLALTMDDIEVFDLGSLSFLLDSASGREAVKHVKYAEELFVILKLVFAHHQDTAFEFQKALMTSHGMTYKAATSYMERYNDMVDRVNAVAARYADAAASSLVDAASDATEGATPLGDAQPFEYTPDEVSGDAFDLAKTPNEGEPGTWHTNPGSELMRLYGSDGLPSVDLDFDHFHNGMKPHAHNWAAGSRDGGADVVPFSPWQP
ncbi:MAG TPA: hypothetical protein VGJ10_04295 [Paraburkholderia sp.]|jgi:hypothetical protein